jgi:hypothetical protein
MNNVHVFKSRENWVMGHRKTKVMIFFLVEFLVNTANFTGI